MAKVQHKGRATYRFNDNPEEQRFAEAWQAHNDQGNTLAHLLDPRHGEPFGYPPDPSDRDIEVAATVVQWLGSPVGQGFLRDLGYVRKEDAFDALRRRVQRAMDKAAIEERITGNRERELHCGGQASALKAVLDMLGDEKGDTSP
jgi:hypothetical protein